MMTKTEKYGIFLMAIGFVMLLYHGGAGDISDGSFIIMIGCIIFGGALFVTGGDDGD